MSRAIKQAPHYVKAIDGRTVSGVFAVHGNVDLTGDRGWPGMFSKTWQEQRDNIRGLWQHDGGSPPIATIDSLVDVPRSELPEAVLAKAPDASGGTVVTRTYLDTPRGNEVLAGIKAGAITQMSYMYDPVKWDMEDNPAGQGAGVVYAAPIRNLREVRLYDVSDVNWGANPATVASKGVWLLPDDLLLKQVVALLREIKEGRRNAGGDQGLINDMHDLCTALGATNCKGSTSKEPDGDDEGKSRAARALTLKLKLRTLELSQGLPAHALGE